MRANEVTTGEVRFSFAHIFKPYAAAPGQEEKYSLTILIPKSDVSTKQRIDAAVAAAVEIGKSGSWNGAVPPNVANVLHDGDGIRPNGEPFGAECKGHWVVTARTKADRPVDVVDINLNPIINPTEVYSGCYGRVCISFYPYNFAGKKGIGCGLGPVQKTKDGEPLGGGRTSAADAFGGFSQAAVNPLTGQPM